MLKIGITGGIGCGKSTVAAVFAQLGIPVLKADDLARSIMQENQSVREAIIHAFGKDAYVDGQVNKSFLASKVFNDPHQLLVLNSIVHPATIKASNDWVLQQNAPYILKEAALFFESGSAKGLDGIIGVSCSKSLRIKRIMDRDHLSREQVLARMNQQIDESLKMKLCDWIIYNNEEELMIPQVLELHQSLLQRATHYSESNNL